MIKHSRRIAVPPQRNKRKAATRVLDCLALLGGAARRKAEAYFAAVNHLHAASFRVELHDVARAEEAVCVEVLGGLCVVERGTEGRAEANIGTATGSGARG